MLQQTQVATVLPYFDRFLDRFPNAEALADAPEADLMQVWQGLGYYRRAKYMQKAAKQIVQHHQGQFPTDPAAVLALPGIGRYTAGAILSIGDGQRMPIVEGNTVRVYSRWTGITEPIGSKEAVGQLWEVAEAMLPPRSTRKTAAKSVEHSAGPTDRHSGIFNQAAMELGAMICKPSPRCDVCPVRDCCAAAEHELQDVIPGKVSTTVYEDRREFAFVIVRETANQSPEYLMHLRDGSMRWSGLWDFPRATGISHDTIETAVDELASSLKVAIDAGPRLRTLRHGVTKFRIELFVHRGRLIGELPPRSNLRWVTEDQWSDLAMPVTTRQIADWLLQNRQSELF